MARVTKALLEGMTKTVGRLYGYPTVGEPAPQGSKNRYKKAFLMLSADQYYNLMVVQKDGSWTEFGGSRQYTASEMEVYLKGLIDGKTHQKRR